MNSLNIIGRLGQDPELRYTPDGKAVAKMSVAVDKGRGKEADWFTIVAWDKTAELVSQHLRKGDKVGVSGAIHQRSYETDDGQTRRVWEVAANRVDFLSPKREEGTDDGDPF